MKQNCMQPLYFPYSIISYTDDCLSLNAICHHYTKKEFKEVLAVKTNLSEIDIDSVLNCSGGADLHSS